jgi:hypothetical protein
MRTATTSSALQAAVVGVDPMPLAQSTIAGLLQRSSFRGAIDERQSDHGWAPLSSAAIIALDP